MSSTTPTAQRQQQQAVTTFPASQAASSDRRFPSTTLAFTELSLSSSLSLPSPSSSLLSDLICDLANICLALSQ